MRARQSIGSASYGPAELRALFEAFDGAWVVLAPNYTDDAAEAARIKLANVILGLASGGEKDAARLLAAAIQIMSQPLSRTGS
jgi:hypothetical protein